jgi:hypothetical protein
VASHGCVLGRHDVCVVARVPSRREVRCWGVEFGEGALPVAVEAYCAEAWLVEHLVERLAEDLVGHRVDLREVEWSWNPLSLEPARG